MARPIFKKRINDHLYVIPIGGKEKVVNITKLKPYKPNRFSPQTPGSACEKTRVLDKACESTPHNKHLPLDDPTNGGITITTNLHGPLPIPSRREVIDIQPEIVHQTEDLGSNTPLAVTKPPQDKTGLDTEVEFEIQEAPNTEPTILIGNEIPSSSGLTDGDSSQPIFGAIDPPPTRPQRNPPSIDRHSYPASHVKSQRATRLDKWKR